MSKVHSLLFIASLSCAVASLSACKPVSKCSATSCNGCCSELGQCLAGNMSNACGRAGTTCKACGATEMCIATTGACAASTGTGGGSSGSGGGTSGTGGGTSGTGGGTSGTGGGGVGGGTVNPNDVEGTCTQTYSFDSDGGTRPCQFGANTPSAIIIGEDGGLTTIVSAVRPDSSFTLANVPMGPYFLKLGTTWFKTSQRRVSLDYESLGRVDGSMAATGTTLTVATTGMQPWNDLTHFMSLYSSNSGVAMEAFSLYTTNAPLGGESAFDWRIPYDQYSTQLLTPMLDSTKGDAVLITQMESSSSGEYRTVGAGSGSAVAMVSGQANTTTVALMSPPASTTPLDVSVSSFSQYTSDFTTGTAPTLNLEFTTGPKPLHERASDGLAFVWGSYPQAGATATPPNPLSYPNPFPASWGTTVMIQYGGTVSRLFTGATEPRRYFSGITTTVPIQALASPIAATISPPKDVQLNGMPFANAQPAVTRTPTISWGAPTLGTVSRYLLRVEQLQLSSGRTTSRVAGTFYLLPTDTSFTLPTNVLLTGQSYVLTLSAYKLSTNIERDLSDFRFPISSASVVSGIVKP